MAACSALSPSAGSAETMVATVDCFMQSQVQSGYASLLGPGSGFGYALSIALTLYVAILGFRLILGRTSLSLGDLAPRMLMIGALLALTSSWATYQTLVYGVLTNGPEEIAAMVNPGNASQKGMNARIDVLAERMVDLADAWTAFDARIGAQVTTPNATPNPAEASAIPAIPAQSGLSLIAPKESLGPNMLLFSALLLVLGSAGVLVVAKVILGILLMLGPVFAGLALFPSTRGLTLGWGRAAITMALVPLMAMIVSAGAVAIIEPLLIDMILSARQGVFSLGSAMTIFMVIILMLVISVQLFRVGRTIVSGWTLNTAQAASAPAQDGPASSAITVTANATTASTPIYNERIQSLIGSVERSSHAHGSATPSVQRTMFLPQQLAPATALPRGEVTNPDRRIAGGRTVARRAPVKPYRSAA